MINRRPLARWIRRLASLLPPFSRTCLAAALLVLSGMLVACDEDPNPVQPSSPDDGSQGYSDSMTGLSAASGANVAEGCSLVTIQVTGLDSLAVSAADEGCGPLAVVASGPHDHDRVEGIVTLKLAVENRGDLDVQGPVAIAVLPDSADVTDPPGLERSALSGSLVTLVQPDSTVAPDADEWAGAGLWFSNEEPDDGGLPSGVRQRFSGLSADLAVQDGVRMLTLRVGVQGKSVTGIPLPQQAPDTVPLGLFDDVDPDWLVPVDILAVTFTEEATDQEKSQAAGIAGATEVVGGVRLVSGLGLDGIYLFRISTDGTMEPLLAAIQSLKELPQVVSAFTHQRINTARAIPDDGPGWDQWRIDPDSADSQNWAQELISAPLAWGCTTGSTAPRISVIDEQFAPVADLAPNLVNPIQSSGSGSHGVRVASLIGARGDNGATVAGMTGMMWDAALTLRDYSQGTRATTSENVIEELANVVAAGDHVVNLSSSYYWTARRGRLPNVSSAADSSVVVDIYEATRDHLQGMARLGPIPLMVVPAGNDGVPAFWAAYPNLVNDFPDRVIVVAGTERGQPSSSGSIGLWSGSNTGPLVDVAAPAEDVYSLDRNGNVSPATGTSYSTPLVAGIAGLLLSFDPNLPIDQLKAMIVEGAANGGRTAGSHSLLNAYEALKEASRRPGAPLCGSRVAADARSVFVERESGWEEVFTMNGSVGDLIVRHQGRIIDAYVNAVDDRYPVRHEDRFEFSSSGWTLTGAAPGLNVTGVDDGSIYNSKVGTSHDADTTLVLDYDGFNLEPDFDLKVFETANYQNVYQIHSFQVSMTNDSSQVCIHRSESIYSDQDFDCHDRQDIKNGDLARGGVALDPLVGSAIVWISRGARTDEVVSGWYLCGDPNASNECRDLDQTESWDESQFYRMDIGSGDMVHLFTLPFAVEAAAVSEDGSELMIQRYIELDQKQTRWEARENQYGNIRPAKITSSLLEYSQCSVEWRSLDGAPVFATAPFEKTCYVVDAAPDGSTTLYDWWIGTMAP